MRTTQQMSITMPNEMAAQVKTRVASGEFASESNAVEKWLNEQVVPAWKTLQSDETKGLSGDDIRSRLKAGHKRATGEE